MAAQQQGKSTPELMTWVEGSIQGFQIEVAEEVLRKEVGKGFTNTPTVITDGRPRLDYHAVKPFGRIEFIAAPDMHDAVLWAREQLIALSPVGPGVHGHYRDNHWILINGQGVEGRAADQALLAYKPGDRVQIVNIKPYARKIEGKRANRRKQWKRRRGLSRQSPNGVYRVVQQMVVQRWSRTVFVDFKLQALEIGGEMARAGFFKQTSASGYYTYPVLSFFIKSN